MADNVYLTRDGYDRLKKELDNLKLVERKDIARQIREAREQGDLSENAEYDAAKEKQGRIEGRIRFLEDKLGRAIIIDDNQSDLEEVRIGSTVGLLDLESKKNIVYKLVDASEANFKEGKISVNSPVGQGLLGHRIEENVSINLSSRILKFKILSIK